MTLLKDLNTCTTADIRYLNEQIIFAMNRLSPNCMVDCSDLPNCDLDISVLPYLQPPVKKAWQLALKDPKCPHVYFNSMLRTVAGQMVIWNWYQNGLCGIPLAAEVGKSNHGSGTACDVDRYEDLIDILSNYNLVHTYGDGDKPHFDYGGDDARDLRWLGVQAFQHLWNLGNDDNKIVADGQLGQVTLNALALSPAEGFYIANDTSYPRRLLRFTAPIQQGKDVVSLQSALKKHGFPCPLDGSFGAATDSTLKKFQAAHGLVTDGICGKNTRLALEIN